MVLELARFRPNNFPITRSAYQQTPRSYSSLHYQEYVHVKAKYANDKHKDVEYDLWAGHSVHLHHQPSIDECSADTLVPELKRSWPNMSSL